MTRLLVVDDVPLFRAGLTSALRDSGFDVVGEAETAEVYANIYLMAFAIPLVSVLGVTLGAVSQRLRAHRMRQQGLD